jgi:acetyl esterase/lipase
MDFPLPAKAPPDPKGITILRDIRYREGPSKQWRLDLAMKNDPGGKPRPAVVVVHGGGWLEGTSPASPRGSTACPATSRSSPNWVSLP